MVVACREGPRVYKWWQLVGRDLGSINGGSL